MPMNATWRPRCTEAPWKAPNSALHGSHHDAHLLTTIGSPRSARSRAPKAAAPPPSSMPACACNAASRGGEPASCARTCAAVRRARAAPIRESEASVALAPGTARRRALDAALAELDADPKARHPSTAWRREFSLLLGLERLLSEDEPELADGTVLSLHQVDALSGTLAALLAAAQSPASGGDGRAPTSASPELLASADILGPQEAPAEAGGRRADEAQRGAAEAYEEDDDLGEDDDEEPGDDELGPVARAAPDADEEDSYEFQDAGELNGDADLLAGEEELEADDELVQEGDEEAPDWVE